MNLPRLAWSVLAAVLVPAGCFTPVPCDDPDSLCLSIADVSRVRLGVVPDALSIADVDGDGTRDLVAASGPAGTVTVLWGGDAGVSGSATTWSIDQEVAGLVVADLDADGRLDLATALPRADAVAVVRGRGGRSFADPERFAVGAVPRSLIAVDLDGASPPELVAADYEGGTVTALHQFVAAPPLTVGPGPRALASGDLDGDGHVDVAVALADADAVQLLRGDGRGALQLAALLPTGAAPYGLVTADFDGDERLDLATADRLDDTVSVLRSAGAGEFHPRQIWPTVPLPDSLVVAHPADSLPVLGVLSESTGSVERLDPRTGGSLVGMLASEPSALVADGGALISGGAAVSSLSPGTGIRVTPLWQVDEWFPDRWLVDLDGDGLDELLVDDSEYEAGTVTLRRDGTRVPIAVGVESPGQIRSAELTGDGRLDLLATRGSKVVVSVQQQDGSYVPGPLVNVEGRVTLADLDTDGVSEVLVVGWTGEGRLDVMRSDASGALTPTDRVTFALAQEPMFVRVVDGDGDDIPDLLITGDGVSTYLEDARPPARDLAFIHEAPYDLEVGDLDQDGRLDALACEASGMMVVGDILGAVVSHPLPLSAQLCGSLFMAQLDDDAELELLEFWNGGADTVQFTPWDLRGGAWERGGSQSLQYSSFGLVRTELDGDAAPEFLLSGGLGLVALEVEFGASLLEQERFQLAAGQDLRFADLDGDGAADLLAFGPDIAVARADGLGGFGPLSRIWPRDNADSRQVSSGTFLDLAGRDAPQFVWGSGWHRQPTLAEVTLDGLHDLRTLDVGPIGSPFLAAARIDGDDLTDLLVVDLGSIGVVLLRGAPDGTLGPPEKIEGGPARILRCALHDVDRDGDLDLVLLRLGSPIEIQVLLGAGDGTFAAAQLWSELAINPIEPPSLVLGDFDRDGAVEIVTLNLARDLVAIRRGGPIRVLLENVRAHASADLDRDGRPELLAAGDAGPNTRLHIGRSRSDGSFGFTSRSVPGTGVRDIQTADIDGDDHLEVLLVDDFGATIVRRAP